MSIISSVLDWLLRSIRGSLTPLQVEAKLKELAAATPEHLQWRASVVDLLKLLQQESGPSARKALAEQFGYRGKAAEGSAEKNNWLYGEIMRRLAAQEIAIPPPKAET